MFILLMGISQDDLFISDVIRECKLTVAQFGRSKILFEGGLATIDGRSFHQIEL